MSEQFISKSEVLQLTKLSYTSIYRRMKRGEFPLPIALSARSNVWIQSEVEAWVEEMIIASRGSEVKS